MQRWGPLIQNTCKKIFLGAWGNMKVMYLLQCSHRSTKLDTFSVEMLWKMGVIRFIQYKKWDDFVLEHSNIILFKMHVKQTEISNFAQIFCSNCAKSGRNFKFKVLNFQNWGSISGRNYEKITGGGG